MFSRMHALIQVEQICRAVQTTDYFNYGFIMKVNNLTEIRTSEREHHPWEETRAREIAAMRERKKVDVFFNNTRLPSKERLRWQ